ncbi:DUF1481 domain-containing protein [Vibrio litoralis]|uniref:DUF1481 domain-containing protein n=1 Tax=Vibrio litoralis TaxID=335972 RepID=UPI0018691FC6|nr:DUF1481 domain-containing protein [Vibrio litoralis]
MKRSLFSILVLSLLAGCSSPGSWTDHISSKFSGSVESAELSGGELAGTSKAFYWYTRALSKPKVASDYVQLSDNAWYKSSYQWQDGTIKEIVREGEVQQSSDGLKPFLVHIRFSSEGEAIYQRYRLDNQVLPLNQKDLDYYSQQAADLVEKVDDIHDQGFELIQGVWNGSTFDSCDGVQYSNLQFDQAANLPISVRERINSLNSYAAFIGYKDKKSKTVTVEKLLSLDEPAHGCIQRAHLIMN